MDAKYMLEFKRKMEGKTNYNKRHKLLLSGETRFIVRITNTQIIVHAVKYEPAGDRTVAYATSKELETQGWPHAHKNIPSAYLTGLLCARRAAKENIISGIIDLGLRTVHKKGRVFSAIKGLVDGGVKIALDETTLPETNRIHGAHLKEDSTKDFEKTKDTIMKGEIVKKDKKATKDTKVKTEKKTPKTKDAKK